MSWAIWKVEQAWWELSPRVWFRFCSFGEEGSDVEAEGKDPSERLQHIYWFAAHVHMGVCVCVCAHSLCKPAKFHLHGQFSGKLAWKCSISYFMNLIGFSWFYKVLQPDTHGWRLHSRRPKTLHLCFSTLARIHWIWSGMTMHLWNVHSLFSCLIQIKKGGEKKSPMRIPYGNTKLAL